MAVTATPALLQTPKHWQTSLGVSLHWRQLATGGANGSKITGIVAASTDSAARVVSIGIGRQISLSGITNASPAVFTAAAAHHLITQDLILLTGGTFGTGLTAFDDLTTGTTYNVIAAGLTTTAFQVSLATTPQGGGSTAVNTSGASSGTLVATVVRIVGSVNVALTAGIDGSTAHASLMSPGLFPGLPLDNDGNPYIHLNGTTDTLYVGNVAAGTANKLISVTAFGGDF